MSQERYVEGRLAFSIRLPSYATASATSDVVRLAEAINRAGFDVKAMDVNIVTKDVDATSDQQS